MLRCFRYGIGHSWWCPYENLNEACQKEADDMRKAFLSSGGQCTDSRLRMFIADSLDNCTIEKIIIELQDIIKSDPERAYERLEVILHTTCVQDLHERGEWSSFLGCLRCGTFLTTPSQHFCATGVPRKLLVKALEQAAGRRKKVSFTDDCDDTVDDAPHAEDGDHDTDPIAFPEAADLDNVPSLLPEGMDSAAVPMSEPIEQSSDDSPGLALILMMLSLIYA